MYLLVIDGPSILILVEEQTRGRVIAEPSDPKRTEGPHRWMVSIETSAYLPSLMRRILCHTNLGFPARWQLLLLTIEEANRICPLWSCKKRIIDQVCVVLYLVILIRFIFPFQFRLTKGKFACIMIFAEALTEIGIRDAMKDCPGGTPNSDDYIL